MALFKCMGYRKSSQTINVYYESGYVNWNANNWGTKIQDIGYAIRPLNIKLNGHKVLGTATWAGNCTTKLYLFNQGTNDWEFITSVKDQTKYIDISSNTNGKWYTKVKLEVGGTSSNGGVNHIGYVDILEYYIK